MNKCLCCMYSKSINQPYPRICVHCGFPEEKTMRTKKALEERMLFIKEVLKVEFYLTKLHVSIDSYKDELKSLEKELEELNKPKRWKPEYGEIYFAVGFDGVVYENEWFNRDSDWHRYKTRNCFKTKEEAEEELERILFVNEVRDFIEEENGDWAYDDKKTTGNRFMVSYEQGYLCITEWNFMFRHTSEYKYFKSKEIGEKILAKFDNQKLIKYFI